MSNSAATTKASVTHLNERPSPRNEGGDAPEHERAKGHEIPLASMIRHGYICRLTTMSGEQFIGKIHSFDKWSVTLTTAGEEFPETFFKHSLERFTRIK